MRSNLIRILLAVALVGALGGSVWAAGTEGMAPQVQTAPPMAAAPVVMTVHKTEKGGIR